LEIGQDGLGKEGKVIFFPCYTMLFSSVSPGCAEKIQSDFNGQLPRFLKAASSSSIFSDSILNKDLIPLFSLFLLISTL